MNVQDFPVTTPYGYVVGYPLNGGFHTGIDYGCPTGTPVIVNGVTIGLSNNTGASTGPHCHVGKYVNGVIQNPGVGNGFIFASAVVYDTGYDSLNGNYVRITGDGALWNYLHLESILVTKGQVLQGENTVKPWREGIIVAFQNFLDRDPTEDEIAREMGQPDMRDVYASLMQESNAIIKNLKASQATVNKQVVEDYISKNLS